jgi:hypothetical protein
MFPIVEVSVLMTPVVNRPTDEKNEVVVAAVPVAFVKLRSPTVPLTAFIF